MANAKDTSAKGFFLAASGHRQAAKIIHPTLKIDDDSTDATFLAFYNVLGFSFELYLKSYLSSTGIDAFALSKKPYSHNLSNLFGEAKTRGFSVQLAAMNDIIGYLSPHHGDYTYRYMSGSPSYKYSHLKPMHFVFQVLDEIHFSLQNLID